LNKGEEKMDKLEAAIERKGMSKMIYTICNGFHNSSARIRVEIGHLISSATMRRANRKLCGYAGCTCASSPASDANENQREGVEGHSEIIIAPAYDYPAQAKAAGWDGKDYDAYICLAR
jgi:hypothetical protein